MIYTIYQCRDPRDNTIRYVGSTCKSLAERWKLQQWTIRDLISKNLSLAPAMLWQKELLDAGLAPVYEEVFSDNFSSKLAAHKAEALTIEKLAAEGHPLTNICHNTPNINRTPRKPRPKFIGPKQPKRSHSEVMKEYWDQPGVREHHSKARKGCIPKNSIPVVMDGVEYSSRAHAARHLMETKGMKCSQANHAIMLLTGAITEQDVIEFKKKNAERTKRNKAKRKAALAPE